MIYLKMKEFQDWIFDDQKVIYTDTNSMIRVSSSFGLVE